MKADVFFAPSVSDFGSPPLYSPPPKETDEWTARCRGYDSLARSCQKATAEAAATLSESTPCDIGMRTT